MAGKSKKFDPPSLWIIAGANGSGKTTAYENVTIEGPRGSVWIINPDELSARIFATEKIKLQNANLHAVKRMENWLYASVECYQTVGVETVLSTDKYRGLLKAAKAKKFKIRLLYFYLNSAELNVERVNIRVQKGGHYVPKDKIVDRRNRSLAQLNWFYKQAHTVQLFDNSGANPLLTVTKKSGHTIRHGALIPEIEAAIS